MQLTIRSAGPDDADVLAVLNEDVQLLHAAHKPELFRQPQRATVAEWFRAGLTNGAQTVWIAEADGAAVGYAAVVVRARPESPFTAATTVYEIDQLGVDPRFRRRGIAASLVRHVLETARAAGMREVTLRSWAFNKAAQEAFRRLGFTPEVIQMTIRC